MSAWTPLPSSTATAASWRPCTSCTATKISSSARRWRCCAPASSAWAEARHGKQLSQAAARLLVDLIGEEMGQLDQELAKLAVYIGQASKIDADDVDKLVGQSRAANVFEILNTLAAGQPPKALAILEQ